MGHGIKTKVVITQNGSQIQRILTGLHELSAGGILRPSYEFVRHGVKNSPHPASFPASVYIEICGKRIFFDMHDEQRLIDSVVQEVDLYFKRSYRVQSYGDFPHIHPYGLSYNVRQTNPSLDFLRRYYCYGGISGAISEAASFLDPRQKFLFRPARNLMESVAILRKRPRILFLARLWDPEEDEQDKLEYRHSVDRGRVNEFRVECAEAIKKEFKEMATVGFQDDRFSRRFLPESLIADSSVTDKRNYVRRILPGHDICVLTTGLNNSTGWKFGEAVAFSKGLVSEPLTNLVPYDFSSPRNYLIAVKPCDFVEQLASLMTDIDSLHCMQKANESYYKTMLNPASALLACLNRVPGFEDQLRRLT